MKEVGEIFTEMERKRERKRNREMKNQNRNNKVRSREYHRSSKILIKRRAGGKKTKERKPQFI